MKKIDLTKSEPLLINSKPAGKNNMTSRALFYQRKLYEISAFNSEKLNPNSPIDLWYDKQMYGRVDTDSRAIHLSERYLKQIPVKTPEPIYAVNFVVDAFIDLRRQIQSVVSRERMSNKGIYAVMNPKSGWTSVNRLYHYLMESVHYEKFKSFIYAYKQESKITDFSSFMNVFLQYIDNETPKSPITRSKLIVSNKLSPLVSGLMIELDTKDHGNDEIKVDQFLNDPNFPLFKETAMRYGFLIDKHAPWRLVADLGSPALKPYMERYGVDKDSVIDKYYYKSHFLDLETLKTYIVEFYNSYVTARPKVVKPKFLVKNDEIRVCTEHIIRSVREKQMVEQEYGTQYWLRLYAFIRAREENKNWNQEIFEKHARNAYHFSQAKNLKVAIEYIDRKCKLPSDSNIKERNYSFINSY